MSWDFKEYESPAALPILKEYVQIPILTFTSCKAFYSMHIAWLSASKWLRNIMSSSQESSLPE